MSRTLTREQVRPRDTGQLVTAHVCGGIAIVPRSLPDEAATERAFRAWLDGDRRYPPPRERLRDGFVLVHANSGYVLTPHGWLLPDFETAKRCVGRLLDRFGAMFDRDVRSIQTLGGAVIAMHGDCGAWTGRHDALRRLGATVDEAEYQKRLAGLRSQGRANVAEHMGLEGAR